MFCWLIAGGIDLVLWVFCYYGFDCVASIGGFCVFWIVLFVFYCLVVCWMFWLWVLVGVLCCGVCFLACGFWFTFLI